MVLLLLGVGLPAGAGAQDTCPAASGPDAEAGWTAYSEGDLAEAARRFRTALERCPDDAYARTGLGYVALRDGETDRALELFHRVLGPDSTHVDALVGAGIGHWRKGELERVGRVVSRALELEPEHPTALEYRERLAAARATQVAPPALLEEAPTVDPVGPANTPSITAAGGPEELARSLATSGRLEASEVAYRALLADDPDDIPARLGLARTLAWGGRYSEALEAYAQVLRRDPDNVGALTGTARTRGWAGRLMAAESAADSAVTAAPSSPDAWLTLGSVYRWQGREVAAREALERAAELDPERSDVQDALRAVRRARAPRSRVSVTLEDDSDRNRMLTTAVTGSWFVRPRLQLRADAYLRGLEQERVVGGMLDPGARSVLVSVRYTAEPGWGLSAGVGGAATDGEDDPSFLEWEVALSTPSRRALDGTLTLRSRARTATALLATRGVRATEGVLQGTWRPAAGWRLDGSVGVGSWEGRESNGRRAASLAGARRWGGLTVGLALRGFSFEEDLNDGYFDPEFYGIGELTGAWRLRTGPWSLVAEVAPGVQIIRDASGEDDPGGAVRANLRGGWGLGPGREIWTALSFSSAGVGRVSAGAADYEYRSVQVGASWAF
jgi:tetratricopeptide (TPR) repeat protein